jgi:hypothetical protein
MIKNIEYSMPRGDSRSFNIRVPISIYSTGASLFFGMKKKADDDNADSAAVLKKTLTDDDISSTTDDYKIYTLTLAPSDTNSITPDTYQAEVEFVSSDGDTVLTFPDPDVARWKFQITPDINRRTS